MGVLVGSYESLTLTQLLIEVENIPEEHIEHILISDDDNDDAYAKVTIIEDEIDGITISDYEENTDKCKLLLYENMCNPKIGVDTHDVNTFFYIAFNDNVEAVIFIESSEYVAYKKSSKGFTALVKKEYLREVHSDLKLMRYDNDKDLWEKIATIIKKD